jgi:hypothetical protein
MRECLTEGRYRCGSLGSTTSHILAAFLLCCSHIQWRASIPIRTTARWLQLSRLNCLLCAPCREAKIRLSLQAHHVQLDFTARDVSAPGEHWQIETGASFDTLGVHRARVSAGAVSQSKVSEEQIAFALRPPKNGAAVADAYQQLGVSEATMYASNTSFGQFCVNEHRTCGGSSRKVFPSRGSFPISHSTSTR